jgi:hypothetical protein
MSALVTSFGVTAVDPQDAALAARFVQRHCRPDTQAVLAILGLDAPVAPPPVPRREPGPRVAPDPYSRPVKGKGRRHR